MNEYNGHNNNDIDDSVELYVNSDKIKTVINNIKN
jgi:hypothetical protein